MPRRELSLGGMGALLQRLVPLAALLGSPCCGVNHTQIELSAGDVSVDGGFPAADSGVPTLDDCRRVCGAYFGVELVYGCTRRWGPRGQPVFLCDVERSNCRDGAGRRPEGLAAASPSVAGADPVGAWLAESAWLEAASVHAFRILQAELVAHGAPVPLRRAAARAAREEVRHARRMAGLARRYGAEAPTPSLAAGGARTVEAIALENAVEGCVRETYGALVAAWQARTAGDVRVRAAMRGIARDEARHAALSWRVAAWAHGRLDRGARARVDAARAEAVAALRKDAARPRDAALVEAVGVPCAAHASALAALLDRALWAA